MSRKDFFINFFGKETQIYKENILTILSKNTTDPKPFKLRDSESKDPFVMVGLSDALSNLDKEPKIRLGEWHASIGVPGQLPGLYVFLNFHTDLNRLKLVYLCTSYSASNIDHSFRDSKYTLQSVKWLYDFFKDLASSGMFIYGYADFDELNFNQKIALKEDGTYEVVKNTKSAFTPAIFNEISFFSKELLDQNDNRNTVLSEKFAKVFKMEDGGLITFDEKFEFKEALLELVKKRKIK